MSVTAAPFSRRLTRVFASRYFWYATITLFVLQALWFVFSARYPMAFDENYHFGLIQLHAQQWLPFFTHQPAHAGAYSAIVRDPSYLYQYLMSFPYRLLRLMSGDQVFQIVGLRLINVALFVYGLFLYRKILRHIGLSAGLINVALAVLTLIPITPFLAAHINYDNMFIVMLGLSVLLTLRLHAGIRQGVVSAKLILALASVLLLGSIVKYPFLPVLATIAVFVAYQLVHYRLGWRTFRASFATLQIGLKILLVVGLVISAGLFSERYAVNVVRYHTPVPACDKVIEVSECSEYGPWERDDVLSLQKPPSFHPNLVHYTGSWFYGMWYRLFFAVNYDYSTQSPIYLISHAAIVLAALVAVGIVIRARAIFNTPERRLLLYLIVAYGIVLFGDEYIEYVKTAAPVAINGRYWIPFLPFAFGLGGLAWSQILRRHQAAKVSIAAVVLALFLFQGGGVETFIVRSQDNWLWQNNVVITTNRLARDVLRPVVLLRR